VVRTFPVLVGVDNLTSERYKSVRTSPLKKHIKNKVTMKKLIIIGRTEFVSIWQVLFGLADEYNNLDLKPSGLAEETVRLTNLVLSEKGVEVSYEDDPTEEALESAKAVILCHKNDILGKEAFKKYGNKLFVLAESEEAYEKYKKQFGLTFRVGLSIWGNAELSFNLKLALEE